MTNVKASMIKMHQEEIMNTLKTQEKIALAKKKKRRRRRNKNLYRETEDRKKSQVEIWDNQITNNQNAKLKLSKRTQQSTRGDILD